MPALSAVAAIHQQQQASVCVGLITAALLYGYNGMMKLAGASRRSTATAAAADEVLSICMLLVVVEDIAADQVRSVLLHQFVQCKAAAQLSILGPCALADMSGM